MSLEINVTKNDILRGQRTHTMACPIARAVRRKLKTEVRVKYDEVVAEYVDWNVTYGLPPEASRFVDEFDSGEPVLPFRFKLINC